MSQATATTGEPTVVTLRGFHQVREAYRQKALRQAMYTEGAVVMADCLLDLHGSEHRDRRRLVNRLFRRDVFAAWENDLLGATVGTTLAPMVDVELSDGTFLPEGSRVVFDLAATNRDPDVWGDDGAVFDPERTAPDGAAPWGHSFGGGTHACIGAELDGGLECPADRPPDDHLYGTVCVMLQAFLRAGGRPDPNAPPQLDPHSERRHFAAYPVVFAPAALTPPPTLGNNPTHSRVSAQSSATGDEE